MWLWYCSNVMLHSLVYMICKWLKNYQLKGTLLNAEAYKVDSSLLIAFTMNLCIHQGIEFFPKWVNAVQKKANSLRKNCHKSLHHCNVTNVCNFQTNLSMEDFWIPYEQANMLMFRIYPLECSPTRKIAKSPNLTHLCLYGTLKVQ